MKQIVIAALIAITPPLALAAEPLDGGDRPLLIEGKHSLYQRVLAAPDARLAAEPGGEGHTAVVPFTSYYVYARREHGETEWIEVGTDRHGTRTGWLPGASTLEWNHGLTAAFRDPEGHDRVLLFKDRASLRRLAQQADTSEYEALYQQAQQEMLPPDSAVVAIQPPGFIDIQEDFYLVPIRQHEDIYLGNEQARLLQVSTVPLARSVGRADIAVVEVEARAYSAGLTFVIDSTLSMDPYIDRTREAVKKIYDTLGDADLLGGVSFGLVAFRDNPDSAAPELEYLARTYVDLEQGRDAAGFLSRVNSLRASSVSSRDFEEDAYAGIKQAIETLDWSNYEARYIVLVTDAGARDADDPLSTTGLDAESLRTLAQEKGIAIFVLHLLTPATMANHAADAMQYQALADFPGIGSLYYGVPTGDVEKFGEALDTLAGQITEQVRLADTGTKPAAAPVVATSADAQLAEFQAKVAKLGYALRMKYLRQTDEEQIPAVFDAWLLDRDFRNPERAALDVRVLLTRDQLSDMHDVLAAVLDRAEEGMLSPQTFLGELQSLAATMTRDPSQLGTTTATTVGQGNSLANLGFMREYIEDLPYTPEVMGLSLDDWQSWSTKQQVAFVTRLEDKLDYYRALHDHTDLWVSLDNGPVSGDSVFPVPLEVLP